MIRYAVTEKSEVIGVTWLVELYRPDLLIASGKAEGKYDGSKSTSSRFLEITERPYLKPRLVECAVLLPPCNN